MSSLRIKSSTRKKSVGSFLRQPRMCRERREIKMKLTDREAKFVISWLAWAASETCDNPDLWKIKDDEMFRQISDKYREGQNA